MDQSKTFRVITEKSKKKRNGNRKGATYWGYGGWFEQYSQNKSNERVAVSINAKIKKAWLRWTWWIKRMKKKTVRKRDIKNSEKVINDDRKYKKYFVKIKFVAKYRIFRFMSTYRFLFLLSTVIKFIRMQKSRIFICIIMLFYLYK